MKLNIFLIFISLFCIISCANLDDEDKIEPAKELKVKADLLMIKKKYKDAAKLYSKIYFQNPGSEIGTDAEILEADAWMKEKKYDEAVLILDNFVKLHPAHKKIDYVYYLRALSYYNQIYNINKDQSAAVKAKEAFLDLKTQAPKSSYIKEADKFIAIIDDMLASKEMEIGRYYLKRKNPVAAISRFNNVFDKYSHTSHFIEAIYRLTECYVMLGIEQKAQDMVRLLESKYKHNDWQILSSKLISKK